MPRPPSTGRHGLRLVETDLHLGSTYTARRAALEPLLRLVFDAAGLVALFHRGVHRPTPRHEEATS